MYFSAYTYGFLPAADSTNEYFKTEVTGYLSDWFYTYTAVSVPLKVANCYLYLGFDDDDLEITH